MWSKPQPHIAAFVLLDVKPLDSEAEQSALDLPHCIR